MKKLLLVLTGLFLMVGCGAKDEYALGTYSGKTYVNKTFNMNFEIKDEYSFLTEDELKIVNEQSHEASKDPEKAKYINKVMELTNTSGVSLVIYVDSTPDAYKNADAEANTYLDFLTEQRIAYKLEKEDMTLNELDYKVLKLEFDFDQRQHSMYAVQDDKIVNIQITYPNGQDSSVEELLSMIDING